MGVRLALNDVEATEFLGGMTVDRHTKNRGYFVETSRRLNNNYKVELEGRFFSGKGDAGARAFETEDFIQLKLVRFF